jgi:hypothetical protein
MDAVKLHAVAAFAAGLIITLFLAAYLTPRTWWRRPNARALLVMVAGAWGFGSLILYATHGPAAARPAVIADTAPAAPAALTATVAPAQADDRTLAASQPFRVHRDLNLRSAPGVHAARVAIVPAGAEVTPTGARHGDWWQIKATVNGATSTGWVSSLWLRRSGE